MFEVYIGMLRKCNKVQNCGHESKKYRLMEERFHSTENVHFIQLSVQSFRLIPYN